MKLAIVTDSTCDWTPEEYKKNDVTMIPLKILIGDETFLDQADISSEEFYDRMEASSTIPSTSQPSPGDFTEIYSALIDKGYDSILSMHIAPVLSGTLQSAMIAAKSFEVPIEVFDSKGATSSLGLLVQSACAMRDAGDSLEEIIEKLNTLTELTHLYLSPDNTDNLVKGGRLPEEQAQGAAMLNIKLVFTLDPDGRLISYDKVKGAKGVIKRYVEIIQEYAHENGKPRIRFMQARNMAEINNLKVALQDAGIDYEDCAVDTCGATIATHTGVGVIGFGISPA